MFESTGQPGSTPPSGSMSPIPNGSMSPNPTHVTSSPGNSPPVGRLCVGKLHWLATVVNSFLTLDGEICLIFTSLSGVMQEKKYLSTIRLTHSPRITSDAVWRHRTGSTLAQVMTCCLTAPSHCLNQCWLLTAEVLWHSPESNFTASAHATILYH